MSGKTFEIKKEHLRLLKRMCWGWQDCEYGAPEVSPKRPYGNSSVLEDIKEIVHPEGELPMTPCPHCEEEIKTYPHNDTYYEKLHSDMETVLGIISYTQKVEEGIYKTQTDYSDDWVKI